MNWAALHIAVLAAIGTVALVGPLTPEGFWLLLLAVFLVVWSGVSLIAAAFRQAAYVFGRR